MINSAQCIINIDILANANLHLCSFPLERTLLCSLVACLDGLRFEDGPSIPLCADAHPDGTSCKGPCSWYPPPAPEKKKIFLYSFALIKKKRSDIFITEEWLFACSIPAFPASTPGYHN
jgi:hypothetical protein